MSDEPLYIEAQINDVSYVMVNRKHWEELVARVAALEGLSTKPMLSEKVGSLTDEVGRLYARVVKLEGELANEIARLDNHIEKTVALQGDRLQAVEQVLKSHVAGELPRYVGTPDPVTGVIRWDRVDKPTSGD